MPFPGFASPCGERLGQTGKRWGLLLPAPPRPRDAVAGLGCEGRPGPTPLAEPAKAAEMAGSVWWGHSRGFPLPPVAPHDGEVAIAPALGMLGGWGAHPIWDVGEAASGQVPQLTWIRLCPHLTPTLTQKNLNPHLGAALPRQRAVLGPSSPTGSRPTPSRKGVRKAPQESGASHPPAPPLGSPGSFLRLLHPPPPAPKGCF